MQIKFQNQVKIIFFLAGQVYCFTASSAFAFFTATPSSSSVSDVVRHALALVAQAAVCVAQHNVLSISLAACLREKQHVAAGCQVVDNPRTYRWRHRCMESRPPPPLLTCKCAWLAVYTVYTCSVQPVHQHNRTSDPFPCVETNLENSFELSCLQWTEKEIWGVKY